MVIKNNNETVKMVFLEISFNIIVNKLIKQWSRIENHKINNTLCKRKKVITQYEITTRTASIIESFGYLISLLKPDTRKYGYIKIEIRFLPDLYPCHMQQIRILNINLKTIRNCIIFIYRMLQIIQKCIKP